MSFFSLRKAADYGCFEREVQRFYPEMAGGMTENFAFTQAA